MGDVLFGGLTASKIVAAGPSGDIGHAAREAAMEWRRAAADILLSSPPGILQTPNLVFLFE